MKQNRFFSILSPACRISILFAVTIGLLSSPSQQLSAQASSTGFISGTVEDLSGTPITGVQLGVSVVDNTDVILAQTCTNSATGQYAIAGVPENVNVYVVADGSGCANSSYGWAYWQNHSTLSDAINAGDHVYLTAISPSITGIDFMLAPAVPNIEYFVFNLDNTNLDQSVRQAIAYGTDRLHILDTAWLPTGSYGTVQNSYVADNHWAVATTSNSSLMLYPFNPAQAQTILNNDGWVVNGITGIREKGGVPLSLNFKTTTIQARQDTGNIFKQEMAAIGIQVNTFFIPSGTFFGTTLPTRDFDIAEYTISYCTSTLDEMCVPFPIFRTGDPSNDSHYSNPTADAEYDAFQVATTHADRLTHAINHQVIVMNDLPVIPLFTRAAATFADVMSNYWAWNFIERLYSAGITGGCSTNPLSYCPDATVTRAQMAVFLEKGLNGPSYTPPTATGTVFTDVLSNYWAGAWIEKLATNGITGGCGTGVYCPDASVTRAQMAVFLLKSEHGSSYIPPIATGTKFTDVPTSYWAASWIEQLANEGITSGCGTNIYCPDSSVTRAQMAVFLVKAFNLP